jgi:hypothetical protein
MTTSKAVRGNAFFLFATALSPGFFGFRQSDRRVVLLGVKFNFGLQTSFAQ